MFFVYLCQYEVFYIRKKTVTITITNRKVIASNINRTLIDRIYLADLDNNGTVNTYELWLGESLLHRLHRHECHNGSLTLYVKSHIVFFTFHIE